MHGIDCLVALELFNANDSSKYRALTAWLILNCAMHMIVHCSWYMYFTVQGTDCLVSLNLSNAYANASSLFRALAAQLF